MNNRIKEFRQRIGMTQQQLADMIGIKQNTLSYWERGASEPDFRSLNTLSSIFHVSVDEILGRRSSFARDPADNWIPVIGDVAAGIPLDAIENPDPDDWEQISDQMARNGRHIALRINGSSMEPRMRKGDVVIVRIQEDAEDGDIVIVKVNGDEATCKKIKKSPDGVTLISLNPAFDPIFYSSKEASELPVRILGRVVELRAKF